MKKIIKKIFHKEKKFLFVQSEYDKVLEFFKTYQYVRSLYECSKVTGFSEEKCNFYKKLCYANRDLGLYYFEANADPQKYMLKFILEKFSDIKEHSHILEVAPGNNPIFNQQTYINCFAVDKNYDGKLIDFNGKKWGENLYFKNRIFPLCWENLSELKKYTDTKFDIVVSSHSFEHVYEPIKSLQEAASVLKPGGKLVLFVPDGFSDDLSSRNDMTHTLYLVPPMIKEFFHYADKFTKLEIKQFRPNLDYAITAERKG